MTIPRRAALTFAIAVTLATLLSFSQAGASPIPAASPSIIATIQLPEDGRAVSVNPHTGLGYAGMINDLGIFDLSSNQYLSAIHLYSGGISILPVAVNTITNRLYTSTLVVNLTTHVVTSIPCGGDNIVINEQTDIIYFGDPTPFYGEQDVVCILDGATNKTVKYIYLGIRYYSQAVKVAVNPVTNLFYISYTGDDKLHVIDGASNTETTKVPIPDIGDVTVNPVTNRIYVVSGTKTIVLDGNTLTELGQISNFASYLLVNPLTNRIFSLNGIYLKVVDGVTNQVVDTLTLPGGASSRPAIDPLRGRIYFVGGTGWYDKLFVIQDVPVTFSSHVYLPLVVR